jgi:hypothetical protein
MPTLNHSWVAGVAVMPSVIVAQDAAYPNQLKLATLGMFPVGVTHEAGIYAPIPDIGTNYAAQAGNACRVYGPGEECQVKTSSTLAIVNGDMVAPDANSFAQPAVHGFPILGYALGPSVAGERTRVRIVDHEICDRSQTTLVKTADYTLKLEDLGKVISSVGAVGTVTIALPVALVGYEISARVGAVQELRLDPNGSETISTGTGVPGTAGQYATANAVGETATFRCEVAGHWSIVAQSGTWTVA